MRGAGEPPHDPSREPEAVDDLRADHEAGRSSLIPVPVGFHDPRGTLVAEARAGRAEPHLPARGHVEPRSGELVDAAAHLGASHAMTRTITSTLPAALLLAACSGSSATYKEAEALAAQGKLEDAATKLESVCAIEPKSAECAGADAQAAKRRIEAGDKALAEGQPRKAARLFALARLTADDAAENEIAARLAKPELVDGLRFEEAVTAPDKARALPTIKAVAAGSAPSAAKAKEWIDRERPTLLTGEVLAACGPRREGSCSARFAQLEALAPKPAGFDEARAAFEAEQKRTAQARAEAERFLAVFAQRGLKQKAYEKCLEAKAAEVPDETQRTRDCRQEAWDKAPHERFDQEQNDDDLFRRRLQLIGDPDVVASFEARRKEAVESGTHTKAEPRKTGGAKK